VKSVATARLPRRGLLLFCRERHHGNKSFCRGYNSSRRPRIQVVRPEDVASTANPEVRVSHNQPSGLYVAGASQETGAEHRDTRKANVLNRPMTQWPDHPCPDG